MGADRAPSLEEGVPLVARQVQDGFESDSPAYHRGPATSLLQSSGERLRILHFSSRAFLDGSRQEGVSGRSARSPVVGRQQWGMNWEAPQGILSKEAMLLALARPVAGSVKHPRASWGLRLGRLC